MSALPTRPSSFLITCSDHTSHERSTHQTWRFSHYLLGPYITRALYPPDLEVFSLFAQTIHPTSVLPTRPGGFLITSLDHTSHKRSTHQTCQFSQYLLGPYIQRVLYPPDLAVFSLLARTIHPTSDLTTRPSGFLITCSGVCGQLFLLGPYIQRVL